MEKVSKRRKKKTCLEQKTPVTKEKKMILVSNPKYTGLLHLKLAEEITLQLF